LPLAAGRVSNNTTGLMLLNGWSMRYSVGMIGD
jgi:hypothetical protein